MSSAAKIQSDKGLYFQIDGYTGHIQVSSQNRYVLFYFESTEKAMNFALKVLDSCGFMLNEFCSKPIVLRSEDGKAFLNGAAKAFCRFSLKDPSELQPGFQEATTYHILFYISASYEPDRKASQYHLPTRSTT